MMLPSKVLEFSGDHFDSRTARNGEFRLFPKMSDLGFSVTDPRQKCRKSILFFEKTMCPSKVLEFSVDHFDSATARIGEFRLFPKMSVFGFCKELPLPND